MLEIVPVVQPALVTPLAQPMLFAQPTSNRPAGDRTTSQNGLTKLKQPGNIYVTSWELQPPTCCDNICAGLKCSTFDTNRAYIYVRDNMSIEVNDTNSLRGAPCNCCCEVQDDISVYYFDRSPFSPQCNCTPCSAWFCCMFFHRVRTTPHPAGRELPLSRRRSTFACACASEPSRAAVCCILHVCSRIPSSSPSTRAASSAVFVSAAKPWAAAERRW